MIELEGEMTENVFRLRLQSGPEAGREYSLSAGSLTIGRYPLADIVIDSPDVAYRHALLTRGESTYRLADLGSDAGTYVNGRRVGAEPVALAPGDVILLGPNLSMTFLAIVGEESAAPTQMEAPAAAEPFAGEYEPPTEPASPQIEARSPAAPDAIEMPPARPPQRATPIHPEPLPDLPPPNRKNNGRIIAIAAGCLLVALACCCSASLFMYFIGGDWLLNQLGMLP